MDDLVAFAGELSPARGFVWILFDRFVFFSIHFESDGFEALRAGAADGENSVVEFYLGGGHELSRDGGEEVVVEHDSCPVIFA